MLDRNELSKLKHLKHLDLIQLEKDYVQNLLLYNIYSMIGKTLVFKGGTCLYKLHNLDRFSEDLDFSVSKHIRFEKQLKKILYLTAQFNVHGRIKLMKKFHNQFNINLEFKGPLYNGKPESLCFIGLDISLRSRPVLTAERKTLYSTYPDIPSIDVFVMDLKEILSEKISAIYSRNKPRDVYDLWFLLKHKGTEIDLSLVQKKLKQHSVTFNKNQFMNKIEEKKPNWKSDLAPIIARELPSFEQVKKEIETFLK